MDAPAATTHPARPTAAELAAGIELLRRAYAEDLGDEHDGRHGRDLTAPVLIGHSAEAELVAREAGVVCGLALVREAFVLRGVAAVHLEARDGDLVAAGSVLARVEGPADAVLVAERTALNVVQRLSGTATLTRAFVDAVEGTRAAILDTRKTTPGMRALQRWAVRCGGGHNHRFGLFDEAMLKDNHIAVAGGIARAVERVRAAWPEVRIHVEVATPEQVVEAVEARVHVVMLDNMSLEAMAASVELVAGRALTEASGGITLGTVRAAAETGVDRISVGALTHSAPALDVALDVR